MSDEKKEIGEAEFWRRTSYAALGEWSGDQMVSATDRTYLKRLAVAKAAAELADEIEAPERFAEVIAGATSVLAVAPKPIADVLGPLLETGVKLLAKALGFDDLPTRDPATITPPPWVEEILRASRAREEEKPAETPTNPLLDVIKRIGDS